jgi:hypothetical protein
MQFTVESQYNATHYVLVQITQGQVFIPRIKYCAYDISFKLLHSNVSKDPFN